ncbi:MAG TPA: type II toxin-antitoxin system RelE/ParE family toxin [Candidatus Ratteibacteria bacterium]|nr:type II toxin-antitoxin system RelE/ParE family toxin [bacterium]HRR95745.1 type II toxin-antitoxin system RelE/ParE family toxin [Candidatus Ratteibacteria bacterium]
MNYEIYYKDSVKKDLKKIPKQRWEIIKNKIEKQLTTNPYQGIPLKGKWEGMRKLESPPYRVIYTIIQKENTILILRIRHRKEVYR